MDPQWTINQESGKEGFCKDSGKESSCNVPGQDSGKDSGVVSS